MPPNTAVIRRMKVDLPHPARMRTRLASLIVVGGQSHTSNKLYSLQAKAAVQAGQTKQVVSFHALAVKTAHQSRQPAR